MEGGGVSRLPSSGKRNHQYDGKPGMTEIFWAASWEKKTGRKNFKFQKTTPPKNNFAFWGSCPQPGDGHIPPPLINKTNAPPSAPCPFRAPGGRHSGMGSSFRPRARMSTCVGCSCRAGKTSAVGGCCTGAFSLAENAMQNEDAHNIQNSGF